MEWGGKTTIKKEGTYENGGFEKTSPGRDLFSI